MAGTSRIDELRKKFDENPRRYFAPLANEYRKIGDFEQAIFICQEFLPQQPGHMSGHIVYGQALFESGRHDDARSVFETALALDPENLIALRHLGDIARAHGDSETARAWYRRVLESDPRNEEIAGILNSLDTDVPAQPAASQAAGGAAPAEANSDGSLSVESAISAATGSSDSVAAPAPDPIVTDPLTTAPSESSFDDIAKLFTSAAPSAPASSADDSLGLIHEGEDVLDETKGRAEEPPLLGAPRMESHAPSTPAEEPVSADSAPPAFNLPFLEGLTSPEPAAPAADASTAFVTETMAELYVKQGLHDQAIDVYRQLVQLHPDDAALASRLRALESGGRSKPEPAPVATNAPAVDAIADAGPTIREFLGSIADFRPRTAEMPVPSVAAPVADVPASPHERPATRGGETVGGSLHNLFSGAEREAGESPQSALGDVAVAAAPAREPAEPEAPAIPGRPSTPAATELSLDHVFRHATPASGSASHSFSFDQFFSQQAQQDVTASDADTASGESAGLSDDIQQFNAWLEGLKKT